MIEAEIKSALADSLSEDWSEWKTYVLSLIAHSLTSAVRALLSPLPQEPQMVTKLSAINELQQVITTRLIDLFVEQDQWLEDAFVEWLFETARAGQCAEELHLALCDVLSVLALREQLLENV
jgi:hypothetical protein